MTVPIQAAHAPRVAVVIVNWNGRQDTLECLDSLARSDYPSLEIMVVDNGSADGSQAAIAERFPAVKLLEAGENLGFAEGNNRGVASAMEAGAEVVFLLNNDTVVATDCVSALARAAAELPGPNALGAKILYHDRPDTIWHFGSRWDSRHGRIRAIAQDEPAHKWNERLEVDHIIGCAMWIPCEVIRKVGLFDARFFLNYEETDWCFRAKRAGVSLFSIPDARVWHKVGASFRTSAHLTYFLERNRLLWLEKNFHGRERWRLVLIREIPDKIKILAKIARRSVECLLYAVLGSRDRLEYKRYKLDATLAAVKGWMHYFRRRFGDCPPEVRRPFTPTGRLKIDSRGATLTSTRRDL